MNARGFQDTAPARFEIDKTQIGLLSHGNIFTTSAPMSGEGGYSGPSSRCPQCGVRFTREGDLNRHVRSVHRQENRIKCPSPGCVHTFTRQDNLLQHQRKFHFDPSIPPLSSPAHAHHSSEDGSPTIPHGPSQQMESIDINTEKAKSGAPLVVKDWEAHRTHIRQLYLCQDLPLHVVVDEMEKQYGFHASARQYKRKISEWKLSKNVKSSRVEAILSELKARAGPHGDDILPQMPNIPGAQSDLSTEYSNTAQSEVSNILSGMRVFKPAPFSTEGDLSHWHYERVDAKDDQDHITSSPFSDHFSSSRQNNVTLDEETSTSLEFARAPLEDNIPDEPWIMSQWKDPWIKTNVQMKPIFLVPFERDGQFVGREDILSMVEVQLQIRHCVSLHGLGGIGKSQIAVEYAYRFRDRNPQGHIFWVSAANAARFYQAYKDIARKLKLPRFDDPDVDVCELASDWLNEDDSSQWLMILDDANNQDLFFSSVNSHVPSHINITTKSLSDYLPRKLDSRRQLIVTTRNRQFGECLSHEEACIEVSPFVLREARYLLQCKAGSVPDSSSGLDFDALLNTLGCIPLAITQATAFMKRNRMSLQRYLESLEKHEQNIKDCLSIDFQDHRRERGVSNSVFRTWEISFNQIREQDPRAASMLSLMAMLDRQQIPEFLLRQHGERDIVFFSAIGTLNSLSLVTKEFEKETFTMHRLIQLSVHAWLEQHNKKTYFQEEALSQLANMFPNGEYENRELCESLLPHAQAVLRYDFNSKSSMVRRAALLHNISWFDWRQGRYHQAFTSCLEAYDTRAKLLGQEDSGTLDSLSLVAEVLRYQGKYEEAEEMHRRALKIREKVLGIEHPDTLTSVNNLALVFRDQGTYEEAEEMHRRALKIREKVLGVEHPETLTSVDNLALVFRDQGKYDEAEEMHRRALKIREKVLGVEHPETLTSVDNLALIIRDQGKYEQAEEMHRQALEGKEKVLGVEHPETLTSVYNLAYLFHSKGQYDAASGLYQRAIAGYQKTLGSHHPASLECSGYYTSMLDELNDNHD